jgi:hypothetical protein
MFLLPYFALKLGEDLFTKKNSLQRNCENGLGQIRARSEVPSTLAENSNYIKLGYKFTGE